mmetsp:Transcript_18953/g.30773  ORF Transcript_18953/g.30773 Transcript_18953/m.30773 type:complete len:426 (+) Transcript_18953:112-1389(+)
MGIMTEELQELELGSCFELVSTSESKLSKATALRYGFVHLSGSDVGTSSPRRAYSAEPRGSKEVEDIAFARYVATFHFSSRRSSVAAAAEGGLKTPTGARQKLADLASPCLACGPSPERPEDLQLDEQSEGEGSAAAEAIASEQVSSPHGADGSAALDDAKELCPPDSPTRMRADAPTFVPQSVRCIPLPLSTMPPSSPSQHLEAGARVPPPPPPSPPPLVAQTQAFNKSPPHRHAGKGSSWRSRQPVPMKAFHRSSGSASSWRDCDENIPPPPELPKLTHALLGRVDKRVQAPRYSDFHASERDGTALETASHGSCSNSTTAPPSLDEVLLPQPPPPDTPPRSEVVCFADHPRDRRRSWADMEDLPGSPEYDVTELVGQSGKKDKYSTYEEANKSSSGSSRKKTSGSTKMSSRNMIWRPKLTSP